MKDKIIFFIILAVVIISGAIFASISLNSWKYGPISKTDQQAVEAFAKTHKDCINREVNFTHLPIAIENLDRLHPLGQVNAASGHVTPTDHAYLILQKQTTGPPTTPVVMPADGTIIRVERGAPEYIGGPQHPTLVTESYGIYISYSCRYFGYFLGIYKLADLIAKQVGSLTPNDPKDTSIMLGAGDVIGYIGGTDPSGVDWTIIDTETTLNRFVHPRFYYGVPDELHVIDPISVYSGVLRDELIAKSIRKVPPYGGKIDYDQPGKLVGNWFRQGSGGYASYSKPGYWDGHLTIAPNNVLPLQYVFSIGNWQGSAQQFLTKEGFDASKIDTSSGIIKLELYNIPPGWPMNLEWVNRKSFAGTVLLQVLSGEKLKIEKFPEKTPEQMGGFSDEAIIYER